MSAQNFNRSTNVAMEHNTKVGIRFNGAYRLLSAVLIAEVIKF